MRSLYLAGLAYLAFSGLSLTKDALRAAPAGPASSFRGYGGARWFAAARPYCNALEVSQHLARNPPPGGWDGAGYAAACQALAGHIPEARRLIAALPSVSRTSAAAIVFDVGHPVADLGGDVAAAPFMELVLEFWPDNEPALFHAGMADHALGKQASARARLERFRAIDHRGDASDRAARKALDRIARGLPADPGYSTGHE